MLFVSLTQSSAPSEAAEEKMKGITVLQIIFAAVYVNAGPSVETKLGIISGKAVQQIFHEKNYVTNQFLGIPYAKPPIGKLRFKRPQPYGRFSAPFDATTFGSACPQNDFMHLGVQSSEEDCLSLNVYVPTKETPETSTYPVMIYFHGGGLFVGASSLVSGHVLCAYGDVILVTINYRLGIFGFANTGDINAQGNMGLWDQRLAIQWVSENIDAFGGDPSRITIFGESAGSSGVFMQAMYPENKGLFQNIIAESGTPIMLFSPSKDNIAVLSNLAKLLGCSTKSAQVIFTCINTTDTIAIMSKLKLLEMETLPAILFLPTFDGEYFKRTPLEIVAASKTTPTEETNFLRSLNIINGMNSAEGTTWISFLLGDNVETATVTHEELKYNHIAKALHGVTMGQPISDLLLSLVATEYTDWTNPSNARKMFVKFYGDTVFNVPGYEMSLLIGNSTHAKHWVYNYAAKLQNHIFPTPSWIFGANHADELMSVFGYGIEKYGQLATIKDLFPPEWELNLSETVMRFWSNFARYGDPNGLGTEEWPRFDTISQKHLTISQENVVGQYLYTKEVNFWREIVPLVIKSTQDVHSTESLFFEKSRESCDKDKNCD